MRAPLTLLSFRQEITFQRAGGECTLIVPLCLGKAIGSTPRNKMQLFQSNKCFVFYFIIFTKIIQINKAIFFLSI